MRIERGDHTPRQALIERIAEVTGHEAEFFSDDDEEDSAVAGYGTIEAALGRQIRRLVDRQVRQAMAAAEKTDPTATLAKATVGSDNYGG